MAADEMLAVARRLLTIKGRRVGDAGVRRAVSTAYYALFHLLTEAACRLYVSSDSPAAAIIRRTLDHEPMTVVSGMFSKNELPKLFQTVSPRPDIPDEVKAVAKAFVELRVEREKADYDFSATIGRESATQLVEKAEEAFAAWEQVKDTDGARLYLASLMNQKAWNEKPRGLQRRTEPSEGTSP